MIVNPILPLYVLIPLAIFVLAVGVICIVKKKYRNLSSLRRILLFVFLLLTLLRPSLTGGVSEQASTNATLFFVIDNTNSMAVKDVGDQSRLTALKTDAEKIITTFPGAHYSLYVQDATTYNLAPATTDANAVVSSIRTLETKGPQYASATDLNDLLAYADDGIGKYAKLHPESQNIVIFMSDGENTSKTGVVAESNLFKNVNVGVVIGYGTADGGIVPDENDYSGYMKCVDKDYTDDNGHCLSRMDENYLKQVAEKNHFEYMHSEGKISSSLAAKLKKNISTKIDINHTKKVNSYIELYWIFAIFALTLLLWEFYSCFGAILSEYEVKKK